MFKDRLHTAITGAADGHRPSTRVEFHGKRDELEKNNRGEEDDPDLDECLGLEEEPDERQDEESSCSQAEYKSASCPITVAQLVALPM